MTLDSSPAWEAFRSEMPVAERYAYFDHASVAPLPRGAHEAIGRWNDQAAESGVAVWNEWSALVEATRRTAAKFVNAAPSEITLVTSTTSAITLVAEGFPWREGDNVVLPAQEFPSNQYPWLNLASRGVEPRRVHTVDERLDLAALAEHCDSRTRIIALSWVGYGTGWRNDLSTLCEFAHQRGILLLVDGIQGLGVLDMDVQAIPIDFLAADGHKWMLGPEGAGLLYIRPEHLDRLRPIGVGWNSVRHAADFQRIEPVWRSTASRYEGGALNMAGLIGFGASLEQLAQYSGVERQRRIVEVTDALCDQLATVAARIASSRESIRKSGIVSFELPNRDPAEVKRHCFERGVLLNARMSRVRVSPHLYTNQHDIDRLLTALRALE